MEASCRAHQEGVTLTEVMVSMAIIGLGIIVGIRAFASIQESIQSSKARTLATNLAQEKIQILKQNSYNRLMITTVTATSADFSDLAYDPSYYVPETVLEGGIFFTRLTYVQWAYEDSGNLRTDLSPSSPDTGMKFITVAVTWSLGGEKHRVEVHSLDANPNTVMSNAILSGVVRSSDTLVGISGAQVNIAENIGWRDTANGSGGYTINLSSGSFNAIATADGYFPAMVPFTVAANQSYPLTFNLFPMSSGTVRGTAWALNHLLITQVVASTTTDRNYEYVELYNPTTSYITMTTGGFHLCRQNASCSFSSVEPMVNTVNWAPKTYYLIANYNDFVTAAGVTRTPDAYYPSIGSHFLESGQPGSLRLHFLPYSNNPTDVIAWKNGGTDFTCSGYYETSPAAASGLTSGEQLVRRTSTSTINSTYASTYDSDNNSVDMIDAPSPFIAPSNSAISKVPIAGTPVVGAMVTVSDGLSSASTTYLRGSGTAASPSFAEFMVPGVATGTWTVVIAAGGLMAELFSATLTPMTTTWVPNSGTSPVWPAASAYSVFLSSDVTTGFVSGRVRNASGNPISGIPISAPGITPVNTSSNGTYVLAITPGVYSVTANQNNSNGTYVSQDILDVTVNLGQVNSGNDFVLSQGGRINGFITRDGTNALSGVAVVAYNADGIAADQGVSGTNGLFSLNNLSTGTYSIATVLDAGESCSPASTNVTLTAGGNVFASTFTVTGAFGGISGTVTTGGNLIKKGVLIVVSTAAISGAPPALSTTTLTGAGYYSNSSLEDGTYRVDVRGSTTTAYRVHGFYFTMNGQTPTISTRTITSVMVMPGVISTGTNLTW